MAAGTTGRPSAASGIARIVRRELSTYLGTRAGWVFIGLTLMFGGVAFNVFAVGKGAQFSADVMGEFFYNFSGVMIAAGYLVSLRSIVEERKSGTLPLLMSSSLTEGEIIIAKYLAQMSFLGIVLLISIYIPALVFIRGKVSFGHIAVGYLGVLLLCSAVVAIGTWASSIAKGWLIAGAVSLVTLALFVLWWQIARAVDGPMRDVLEAMALHNKHFLPFKQGTLSSNHVVFYLSMTVVFLTMARNGLEARRWSS